MAKISTILPSGSSGISLTNISAVQPVLYNSNTGVISSNKSSFTEDGYLSKTDWNIFNSKQDKLNGTGFVKSNGTTISYDNNIYLTANDLPSNLDLYATTFPDPVISGYTSLVRNITDERYDTTAVNVSTPVINGTLLSPTFCGAVISDPSILLGNPGVFNFSVIGNIRRVGGSTSSGADFFFTIYKRNLAGIETKIVDSAKVPVPANGGVYIEYISIALWNDGIFLSTDRIVLKFYGIQTGGGSGATYEFLFGGSDPVRGTATISSSIIPNIYLKDLADVEKVPALDKEILYWNDTDSLWEHSLAENLVPSASTTQKGLVTIGNQVFGGIKTFDNDLIVNGINVGRGGSNTSVLMGLNALSNNILGIGNVAIGSNALLNATGNNNVAIGLNALQGNTGGGDNIAIGQGTSTLGITNTNSIVIGNGATGLGNNTTVLGTTSTTTTGLYGNIRLVSGMATAPASATATGVLGDVRVTGDFIYVCIATNTWRRTALTNW